eukprot:45975_1
MSRKHQVKDDVIVSSTISVALRHPIWKRNELGPVFIMRYIDRYQGLSSSRFIDRFIAPFLISILACLIRPTQSNPACDPLISLPTSEISMKYGWKVAMRCLVLYAFVTT